MCIRSAPQPQAETTESHSSTLVPFIPLTGGNSFVCVCGPFQRSPGSPLIHMCADRRHNSPTGSITCRSCSAEHAETHGHYRQSQVCFSDLAKATAKTCPYSLGSLHLRASSCSVVLFFGLVFFFFWKALDSLGVKVPTYIYIIIIYLSGRFCADLEAL